MVEIKTPRRGFAPVSALLAGRRIPALLARFGQRLARIWGKPWRFGRTVIVVRHAHVAEMLRRDLDFLIGPNNGARIESVNGPFVLGMDRSPTLDRERRALYSALAVVDLDEIANELKVRALTNKKVLGNRFDAICDFIRPLAAQTAMRLFGIKPDDEGLFAEVARAIFAHTFLNVSNDPKVEARALAAAPLLKKWLQDEISQRRGANKQGTDFMGQLLRQTQLDDDVIRRTLGGMLVGSIDTTTTATSQILHILLSDQALLATMRRHLTDSQHTYGLCLEALRRWPHNPILARTAAVDTSLAGRRVPAGARVIAWTQAAMLDPAAFPDPKRMLASRPMASYLHLGAGLHPCAGRMLNAIQIPILVGTLIELPLIQDGRMKWAGPFPDSLPVKIKQITA